MNIKRIVVGVYAVNCYIVYNDNKNGFIVDPGGDSDDIIKFVDKENIKLEFILLTHGHADHIGAVKIIKEKYDLPIYTSINEKDLLEDPILNLSKSIPPFKDIELIADRWLYDEEIIDFYGEKLYIMETPGHTIGSICILMDGVIFSGDTLFRMSIGRSDLPTGSFDEIINSVKKLYNLKKDYRILPGHGAESNLQFERENNPFMKNM
ncbi:MULTISPECIES: MBL fold metallo-hydrolase [unclassified Parvimonas]|uniref:MBL fold metallo-hydrolase n=1 Tax=unclassified Parvimonas TaxID=1151464 RepID=UPI002B49A529|nr:MULTISPECIES: MBL fold metallo-hydrolase [unclassified Parvimonas]MEB3024396.1 MBL fold metallo-hydrolase [Parvimonas sp. M13]MEB3088542.1 MBL fold metallo-hydrolase [Parvimonas sp. M20]